MWFCHFRRHNRLLQLKLLFLFISGSNITSSRAEFFQNVWNHFWRPKDARREAVCLSELLGPDHADHWCHDHGSRGQHGLSVTSPCSLCSGKKVFLLVLKIQVIFTNRNSKGQFSEYHLGRFCQQRNNIQFSLDFSCITMCIVCVLVFYC